MKKRLLGMLLCLVMCLPLVPTVAFAENSTSGSGWNLDDSGCLHITGAVTNPSTTSDNVPWKACKNQIKSVVTTTGASIDSGRYLFADCANLTRVDLSNLNTSRVTDMSNMFAYCRSLKNIDVSNLNTSRVTDMSSMFRYCSGLTSLDVSHFDTSNVKYMYYMFRYCSSLQTIDVSGFNTANVTDMDLMFQNCSSLTSIDVSNFDTSHVTDMGYMFDGCSNLQTVNISNFDAGNVTNVSNMFTKCPALTEVGTNHGMLAQTANQLMLISSAWENKNTGAVYANADALKAITGKVTLVRKDTVTAPAISVINTESTGKPKVSWAKVDGAAQYEVYRSTSRTGTYTRLTTTSNLYLNHVSAVAGTTYYYKVRALNAGGMASEYSNIVYITCDCAKPVVKVSANSSGKPYLSWEKVDGATSYEIYYATSAGGEFTKLYTTSNLYLNHNSAAEGKTYYYKVVALSSKSSYATSAYSDVVSFKVAGNTAPAAPSISISNNASTGKPRLSWKAVSGATQYEVYRATSKTGTYSKLTTTTNLYLNNTSAEAGTTYYYKVRALNAGGTAGEYSNIVYITCDCAKPVVSVKLNSSNHPYISWSKVDGATSYEIYYATSAGGEFTKLYTTSNLYLNHNSAKAGTTYYYKVLALSSKSSYATSAYSDVVSIQAK